MEDKGGVRGNVFRILGYSVEDNLSGGVALAWSWSMKLTEYSVVEV
jgi:hypothetical protein